MERSPTTQDRVFSDEVFADRYARHHQKMAQKLGRQYAAKLRSRSLSKRRILDSGCGFGATDIVLALEFPQSEIIGIDLSEPLLRIAKDAAEAAGVQDRVRFELADVEQIPYENDSFDVVLNLNMVHIVEDPVRMLNEIERVLKPNGHLFVADLRRSWLGVIEKEIKSALTVRETEALLNQSRLRKGTFSSSLIWWRFEN